MHKVLSNIRNCITASSGFEVLCNWAHEIVFVLPVCPVEHFERLLEVTEELPLHLLLPRVCDDHSRAGVGGVLGDFRVAGAALQTVRVVGAQLHVAQNPEEEKQSKRFSVSCSFGQFCTNEGKDP